jgi:hypothetical protein
MRQFVDNDKGYLEWLQANPQGFVVNSPRVPSASYLALHRATCPHISQPTSTIWTAGQYSKTCAVDRAELEAWAHQLGGTLSLGCGCKP